MNTLLLGPLLGNNRAQLIERCRELVAGNQADKFLYLAASSPLLDVVTEGILDGEKNRGVFGNLPVYLFRGFVRLLLSTAVNDEGKGLAPRLPIDREELPLKRSLISQILARLNAADKLRAIGPLAGREGCVNSIATLIGEIQRAAKTPDEVASIIASRTDDQIPRSGSQVDFDNEIALIYTTYCEVLQQRNLTEDDADQLRALAVLRGEIGGQRVHLPWLSKVELLILDGFFDFTPVQGEILRELIPRVPETIVNLNHDSSNPEIFSVFGETIEQLKGIASFDTIQSDERLSTSGALSNLRTNLFNPHLSDMLQLVGTDPSDINADSEDFANESDDKLKHIEHSDDKLKHIGHSDDKLKHIEHSDDKLKLVGQGIRYFECGDRETEIRAIAKEIKHLITNEHYQLDDIALVVRERNAYAQTIARVMREESIPCKLETRIDVVDIPATRAALKLLELLEESSAADSTPYRVAKIADLIKSEYFKLSDEELDSLSTQFDENHLNLLSDDENESVTPDIARSRKKRYRIGFWDADALENAFAYVGSDLPIVAWLKRADQLVRELPGATATKEILSIDSGVQDRDADIADQVENAETAKLEDKVERKRRPSRDIHPATLAWTSLVVQRFAELIFAVPRMGTPVELRQGLMRLLDQFGFREQIVKPTRVASDDQELPQVMLNFNALESLRRAMVAAIKSFEFSMSDELQFVEEAPPNETDDKLKFVGHSSIEQINLSTFIREVRRSLGSQSQLLGPADRGGLQLLEATDVRGLKFKAIFIAGLVEGGFPLRASRDWIYPHEERERLKKYGLTLEDISPATLLKEEHYFYQSACRATERLYLTRPLLLEDDSETVPSYYIDELRRAVAPIKIEAEPVRRDYDGKDRKRISSQRELSVGLIRQEERHLHHGQRQNLLPQAQIRRLLGVASNDGYIGRGALSRIDIERQRAGDQFGPYDGAITDPHLLALLQKKFGPDFVHSASGLSVYGNCAYRFFAQRVLKLEPRGEAALDLQAIDAGKLLHDILRRFLEKHRRKALYELNREDLRNELMEIADRVFDEHERVVPPLNRQIWKIDREIRKILLEQILIYEIETQQKLAVKSVLPSFFEIAFGGTRSSAKDPESTDQPLEITRTREMGVEESIRISGQIDRVDLAEDDTLVAYDYKLSVGASREDILSGRSLQIPIYLEALERLILPGREVAGGGYYIMRGGSDRRNKGLYRTSQDAYLKLKAKNSVFTDEDWQNIRVDVIKKVWEFLDQMRAGKFFVNPSERKKTCRFCDFGAVCRYDRGRIELKKKTDL